MEKQEPSVSRSPLFVEAKDGYETRLMARMKELMCDAQSTASEIDAAMLSLSYRLSLEQENRELRKLIEQVAGLKLAPVYLNSIAIVAETSGDIIVDITKAVATELESQGMMLSVEEMKSTVFTDAVRRRLKERTRANPPPVPKELREPK